MRRFRLAAISLPILLLLIILQHVVRTPSSQTLEGKKVADLIKSTLPQLDVYPDNTILSSDFNDAMQLLRIPRVGTSTGALTEVHVLLRSPGVSHGTTMMSWLDNRSDDAIIDEILSSPIPSSPVVQKSPPVRSGELHQKSSDSDHLGNITDAFHSDFYSYLASLIRLFFTKDQGIINFSKPKPRMYDLPRRTAKEPPTHGWRRFYIALNLYNNEATIPFLTGALVAFIEDELAPFFDVATSVVVSIFSNGSKDHTAMLVEKLLIPRLQLAGVRNIFATVTGTCYTYTKAPTWMQRIEWMSCVRNKALEPLYNWGMQLFTPEFYASSWACEKNQNCTSVNAYLNENNVLRRYKMGMNDKNGNDNINGSSAPDPTASKNANNENSDTTTSNKTPGISSAWETVNDDPDGDNMVVLFFNDIFFRPQDITSLLESVEEPIIASRTELHGVMGEDVSTDSTLKEEYNRTGTTFDMACGMDFYFSFYDRWVSRDRLGNTFLPHMPYTDEPETQAALGRISAQSGRAHGRKQAVPVKCCWNGVAAIRGRFFLSPLRMKGNESGSESTLHKGRQREKQQQQQVRRRESKQGEKLTVKLDGMSHTLEDEILLWKGRRYRYAPEANEELISLYKLMLIKRLSLRRERWNYKVHKVFHEFGASLPPLNVSLLASELRAENETFFSSRRSSLYNSSDMEVRNSIYYRAVEPAIRFRHSLLPSFGATVEGRHTVQDNVCVSSECLLICEDIFHAALLEGRAPVILMNPNVKVAYESAEFDRVTAWMYNSHILLTFVTWARYLLSWFSFLFHGYEEPRCSGPPTSAADDWTAGDHNRTVVIAHSYPNGVTRSRIVNITRASFMFCPMLNEEPVLCNIKILYVAIIIIFLLVLCIQVRRKCEKLISPRYVFLWRRLRGECLHVVGRVKWYVMRALTHPRGKMAFGCPRCIARAARFLFPSFFSHYYTRYDALNEPVVINL